MFVRRGFTFVELVVVLIIVALLIAILLPTIGAIRRGPSCMQNSTQGRGIHCALVLYSQGNNGYYPGIDRDGKRMKDYSTEYRFKVLFDDNYFTGEYIISPSETKVALTKTGVMPTTANYSYAFLNISNLESKRMDEWKDTTNSEAAVLSDRAIAVDDEGHFKSVHVNLKDKAKTLWQGSVGFNDNHVKYLYTYQVDTQYGDKSTLNDNLFNTTNGSMVYSGNDVIIDKRKN
jgi:prepilin-type N-terminal cleavage/methylation domain-containing protein